MKKMIITTSLLFKMVPAFSANHLLVLGGGGEPRGDKTIFDRSLEKVGSFKTKAGNYKSKISFNGGHAQTESIISKNFTPQEIVGPSFDRQSMVSSLQDYIRQIKNGEIKSGDQLLIYIDSHGAEKAGTEETHRIAEGNSPIPSVLFLGKTVTLDELKPLTQLAKEKGIKLGILDFSCFSGETLALRNENTCVISATGSKHFSYSGHEEFFNSKFLSAMEPGKSLEEIYLSVRGDNQDLGFPMISSPVGLDVQRELYNVLTPYFYYFDTIADQLQPHLEKTATEADVCKDEDEFELIKKIIDKAQAEAGFNQYSANYLRGYLAEYKNYQKELKQKLSHNNPALLAKEEEFCLSPIPARQIRRGRNKNCTTYTWEMLLNIDFDDMINYFQSQLDSGKTDAYRDYKTEIELINKAKNKTAEIKAKYPDLKTVSEIYKEYDRKEDRTYSLAANIAIQTHKLYTALYTKKSETDQRPNPCKDFKL